LLPDGIITGKENQVTMATGTGLAPNRLFQPFSTSEFRSLQNRVNRLFEEGFGALAPSAEESWSLTNWSPPCDIYETEAAIVVKAELPEVKREDVNVSLENNVLTIRGERKLSEETRREDYHRVERRYGEFVRSFSLPTIIDPNSISAQFKEGMLIITLPKREEAKPKQIEVKIK
jgi:HSP20 family protein